MNEFTIVSNGRNIHTISFFPQTENFPVLIASHGFNGTGEYFSRYAEKLCKENIGVIAFDFCGGSNCSKSSLLTKEMTIFTEKEDLNAVIDYAKKLSFVTDIYCHGDSMGGFVSALAAEERDDIKGLSLLYPAFCIPDNWTNHFPDKNTIPPSFSLWDVELGKDFFTSIYDYNVFDHIGKYDKNVLLMHGDKDSIVPLEYSKKASTLYPFCTFRIFPGEGHGFSEKGTDEVINLLIKFISGGLE